MLLNCIIDGNYILSRLVFTLHKNNLLYGALYQALENSLTNYRSLYPYSKIYFVSDSKERSWRKQLNTEYKSQRKKDTDIDWKFVYDTYNEFKDNIGTNRIKVLEYPRVEGDDWISLVVNECNKKNESTFIITNDHDIKQLLNMSLDDMWINIMSNEMYNKSRVFIPKTHEMFFHKLASQKTDDIFNLNNDDDFLKLYSKLQKKYEITEVDPIKSLMIKIVSGDRSDNIPSVYKAISSNGRVRGIGEKGALTIYDIYLQEFGEVSLTDPDLAENFADIICEKKKLSKTNIPNITTRIYENFKMMDLKLENIPEELLTEMKIIYG